MGLANYRSDVVFREEIEHVVGHEPIAGSRGFRYGGRAVCENNLRPGTERSEALPGQAHHGGTEIERPVAGDWGKVM
jgi:hypothetical protein